MNRLRRRLFVSSITIVLTLSLTQLASAQRGRFFGVNRVQLASLKEVQSDLKLTEDQKKLAKETNEKMSEDRRSLFQGGGGGDFAEVQKKMEKMNTEATAKLTKDQVELFGKMKGKEMDIDTSSLFPRGGGGGGRQGGGDRPSRPQ